MANIDTDPLFWWKGIYFNTIIFGLVRKNDVAYIYINIRLSVIYIYIYITLNLIKSVRQSIPWNTGDALVIYTENPHHMRSDKSKQ